MMIKVIDYNKRREPVVRDCGKKSEKKILSFSEKSEAKKREEALRRIKEEASKINW